MLLFEFVVVKVNEWDWMIDVNIKGVFYGIVVVLFEMMVCGVGYIVNIVLIGVLVVLLIVVVYCVKKYVVWVILDGLWQECFDICVICINFGVVESEFVGIIIDLVVVELM